MEQAEFVNPRRVKSSLGWIVLGSGHTHTHSHTRTHTLTLTHTHTRGGSGDVRGSFQWFHAGNVRWKSSGLMSVAMDALHCVPCWIWPQRQNLDVEVNIVKSPCVCETWFAFVYCRKQKKPPPSRATLTPDGYDNHGYTTLGIHVPTTTNPGTATKKGNEGPAGHDCHPVGTGDIPTGMGTQNSGVHQRGDAAQSSYGYVEPVCTQSSEATPHPGSTPAYLEIVSTPTSDGYLEPMGTGNPERYPGSDGYIEPDTQGTQYPSSVYLHPPSYAEPYQVQRSGSPDVEYEEIPDTHYNLDSQYPDPQRAQRGYQNTPFHPAEKHPSGTPSSGAEYLELTWWWWRRLPTLLEKGQNQKGWRRNPTCISCRDGLTPQSTTNGERTANPFGKGAEPKWVRKEPNQPGRTPLTGRGYQTVPVRTAVGLGESQRTHHSGEDNAPAKRASNGWRVRIGWDKACRGRRTVGLMKTSD